MLVKCWDLNKEKRPKEKCYKAPNKHYYSSEEAYLSMKTAEEWRNRCTAKMQDIMGYDYEMKLPTSWYKFLNEFYKYGYDVVFDTLEANEQTFQWALQNKTFRNDSCALAYFKAIIQNSIMEQYRKKITREKAKLQELAEAEKREQAFATDLDIGQKSVKGNDLSSLFSL